MRGLSIAIAVTLTIGACTSDGESDGGRSEIFLQVEGEREETAVYRALARAFEQDNPDVKVTVQELDEGEDMLATLATSFAAGDPPDTFLINFRDYSQFAVEGALGPVEAHLEERGVDYDDFYPQPLEAFTIEGELQCMPQNISSLAVYYNVDLFERAGVDPPQKGWTWEEFRSTARALTSGDVDGLGIEPKVIRIAPFVWSNGGEIVDDTDNPSGFTLDDGPAREAFEFIVSLVRDDRVVPTEREIASQDLETRFVTNKLGMILTSRRDTPVFREVQGLNWDVAPLPVALEPAGILHSDAYCVARDAGDPETAFDFIAFAMSREGQTISALAGRTVPSLRSVAKSGAFLDPSQPPAHARVFLDGIPFIRRTPVIPTWPRIEDVSEEILTRAFYEDGYSIDEALRDLDDQTRPLFEEAAG